jgi:ABC-type transport system involved in cytochrome c biogenesis permease subunit
MKTTIKIMTWTLAIIGVTTVLSYKNNLATDGLLNYGFPFAIYESCGDCVAGFESGYKWSNLFKNFIAISLIVSFVILIVGKYRSNKIEKV